MAPRKPASTDEQPAKDDSRRDRDSGNAPDQEKTDAERNPRTSGDEGGIETPQGERSDIERP